jgi:8-oxo-dGTP pyrophosphatase MutT (NUDIX family)
MEEADSMNPETRGSRENPIRSACVVIQRGGRYSALRHAKRHLVEFAGGKCDPGETIEECAIREGFEELGVEVFNLRPLFTIWLTHIDGRHYVCTVFHADIRPDAELKSSTEGEAFWATREELITAPDDRAPDPPNRYRMHVVAITMIENDVRGGLVEL